MSKIIILGSRGMLGQMVKNYFCNHYDVIEINQRYTFENRENFIEQIKSKGDGIVVNCIGKIKQKSNDLNDLLWVNSTLPLDLKSQIGENQFLIHPSTDCVFSGDLKDGKYANNSRSDALDEYGWSKFLGEQSLEGAKNAMIIRVSIIGPDMISDTPKGLLGWFLGNSPGSLLKGFSNHLWNGITTLEWCKQLHQLMIDDKLGTWAGKVLQLGTETVYSKKEMLDIFQKAYKTDFTIAPFRTPNSVNRCLEPDIISSDLLKQIKELINLKLC